MNRALKAIDMADGTLAALAHTDANVTVQQPASAVDAPLEEPRPRHPPRRPRLRKPKNSGTSTTTALPAVATIATIAVATSAIV
jgi:hypothetical protein